MATYKQYKDNKTGIKKWEWRGYVCVDPNTDKKIISAHRGFKTKRDAVNDFDVYKTSILNGDVCRCDLTFDELFESFVEYKRDKVKESTIRNYKLSYKVVMNCDRFNPERKIATFNKMYCNHIYKTLQKKYKRGTTSTVFTFLIGLFNYAIKQGYINNNPFKLVDTTEKYARVEDKKVNSFNKEQLKMFLKYASRDNKLYFVFFHLLAFTGMRQGEARALKWSDINFDDNTITISKTITHDENNRERVGTTPKTRTSHRVIKMDSITASIMKHHRDECRDYYTAMGQLFRFNDGFIFEIKRGRFLSSATVAGVMKRYCMRSGVPVITPHGLRHTYVSLMIEAGVQPIEIAHNIGHSDLKMIMRVYDEMNEERKEKTADIFAQFMAE